MVLNILQTLADSLGVPDLFESARIAAIVTMAGASFASPFVMKGDALADVGKRLTGDKGGHVAEPTEQLVAGGFAFAKPESWGRLGAASAETGAAAKQLGTVVGGVCPAGGHGASCTGDLKVTFIAYDGEHGKLPLVSNFEQQLDETLPKRFKGFRKVESGSVPAADGTPWLRYEFTYASKAGLRREVLGAYRHGDGSGVVVVAVGPNAAVTKHAKPIAAFFSGAAEVASASEAEAAGADADAGAGH